MSTQCNINKRDFGSFHSSNVSELINLPEDHYIAPYRGIPKPDLTFAANTSFGKDIRKSCFFLEDECTYLNHGSFGAALKPALDEHQAWQRHIEKQPTRFYDRECLPLLAQTIRKLSKFIDCEARDVVLVQNASTGINAVIKSIDLMPDDTIYCLNITYGAVKILLKDQVSKHGAKIQEETLNFPVKGKEEIISLVDKTLRKGTKLAVFDHIPSNYPIIMPIKEIIEICHERGVKVLIDGAHAMGTLDLNLRKLNPDFYTSNCHKWFCCTRGCAFLYVARQHQHNTHSLVTSHGFNAGFNSDFIWSGTISYCSYIVLETVIDFWLSIGIDNVRRYNHSIIVKAAEYLTEKWQSKVIAPMDMFGSMACIQLPKAVNNNVNDLSYDHAEYIEDILLSRYNIQVPLKIIEGELYVRISAHVYNVEDDYKRLADAIIQLADENILSIGKIRI